MVFNLLEAVLQKQHQTRKNDSGSCAVHDDKRFDENDDSVAVVLMLMWYSDDDGSTVFLCPTVVWNVSLQCFVAGTYIGPVDTCNPVCDESHCCFRVALPGKRLTEAVSRELYADICLQRPGKGDSCMQTHVGSSCDCLPGLSCSAESDGLLSTCQ